jgi:DeoR/GlpR family transcriptional regulator of sugar metabolism
LTDADGSTVPDEPQPGRGLLTEQRRLLIAERLRREGSITVAELEEAYGISAMTARRDLAALVESAQARRTHGGAVSLGYAHYEGEFAARVEVNREKKERIAKVAASLVRPDDAVFFDGSSTAYYIARALLTRDITVTLITSSLPILALIFEVGRGKATVIAIGGLLRERSLSFVGPHATTAIRAHFADIALLSGKSLASEGYLTDADSLEAEAKRAMVEQASRRVLAIDSSKFASRGLHEICHLRDITTVITDEAGTFAERFAFDGEVLPA